jgi:hypothetical protein
MAELTNASLPMDSTRPPIALGTHLQSPNRCASNPHRYPAHEILKYPGVQETQSDKMKQKTIFTTGQDSIQVCGSSQEETAKSARMDGSKKGVRKTRTKSEKSEWGFED